MIVTKFFFYSFLIALISGCSLSFVGGKRVGVGQKPDDNHSSLTSQSTLCETIVSVTNDTSTPALMVQLGVCGKMSDVEWKALAVTEEATEVTVKSSSNSAKSPVIVSGKDLYVKDAEGQKTKIGAIDAETKYVTLESFATVQVMVDGKPFQLDQHKKDSAGKSILVTIKRH